MASVKWYEDPVYIKMCEKAVKIQKAWIPSANDYAIDFFTITGSRYLITLQSNMEYPFISELTPSEKTEYKRRCIWLPRQGQLQKMVQDVGTWADHNRALAQCFASFCNPSFATSGGELKIAKEDKAVMAKWGERLQKYVGAENYLRQFTSMEQLWLAFVMKEKYNKTWNGKDWVSG